jgi:hypothetical protein
MHPLFTRPLSIAWNVTAFEVSADGFVSAVCQKCQTKLDINQPQENDPNELLGTCSHCGCWHLIQVSPDGAEALLFNVPGVDFVRATLAEARKEAEQERHSGRRPRSRGKIGANGQA